MTNSFNSRESYLEATALWKAEYNEHIKASRASKLTFKEAQRAYSAFELQHGSDYRDHSSADRAELIALHRAMNLARANVLQLRWTATSLIADRHAMKVEAARQMEEARSART